MAGLFGAIRSGLGKINQVDPTTGLSFSNRIGAAGAALGGDTDALAGLRKQGLQQAQAIQTAKQLRDLDELAQRVGLDPQMRLLLRTSPAEGVKALAEHLKPQVVGNDSSVYSGGEFQRPEAFKTINDELVQIPGSRRGPQQMEGFTANQFDPYANQPSQDPQAGPTGPHGVYTAAPSYSDVTSRMTATKPQFQTVGEGQSLVQLPGAGAAPSPAAASGQGRAQRNNNPGNIRDSGDRWQGMTGIDDGGFVQFDTPENGIRAADINLANQQKLHGINTLEGLVAKYAPRSDGNNVGAYVASVARQTGLDPRQPLDLSDPQVRARILPAMFQVESGGTPAMAAPQQASASVVFQGAPKATTRPATAAEKAAYGVPADVPAMMKPDGSIQPITGTGAALKPVPSKIQEGISGNRASIRQIDEAIAQLEQNPGAMGLKNFMGEGLTQRVDAAGVPVRAAVANIGSLIRHDRSGAAVTAAETPILKPFIPSTTDTAQTAITKLKGLRRQYENTTSEMELLYGSDSGYRPMGGQSQRPTPAGPRPGAPTKVAAPSAAVAFLKQNPNLAAQFDAKYGKGAAAGVLGR